MRPRLALAAAAAFVIAAAAPAAAQARLTIDVVLPAPAARATEGPTVTVQNVFADSLSGVLLSSGFAARLTVTVELWGSRTLFDDLIGNVSWQRVVRYDPMFNTYRVGRIAGDSVVDDGRYASLDEVRRAMSVPARAALAAPRGRRGLYYTTSVTVEIFNSNDLAELQRWLSGGQKNPVSALKRGLFRIGSRLLGGDVKRAAGRSGVFDN